MKSTAGRVAVVTGGASGIGLGMVRAFARAGMRVVLADVRPQAVTDATEALRASGHEVVGVVTDVSVRGDVARLAEATLDAFGAVHVVCNNAGVGMIAPLAETSLEDFEWILGVNLWGPIHGAQIFLPLLQRQDEAHLSATSSSAGLVAFANAGPYNISKHGVVGLMTTLERELRLAGSSVRTSVICPLAVATDITRTSLERRRAARGRPLTDAEQRQEEQMLRREMVSAEVMDSDEAGQRILNAILADQFWIFPDARLEQLVRSQTDAMLSGRQIGELY